jgi:dUTP pyrophosphatase
MKLLIKPLHADAVVPTFAHPGDAGMDLVAVMEVVLEPGARALVPTGLALAIPDGFVGLIWDKSGRAVKEGLTTLAGVIDAGYRGEVQVAVYNTSDTKIIIAPGQKVAQLLIQPIIQPEIAIVEQLDDTARSDGGFGSTGL